MLWLIKTGEEVDDGVGTVYDSMEVVEDRRMEGPSLSSSLIPGNLVSGRLPSHTGPRTGTYGFIGGSET